MDRSLPRIDLPVSPEQLVNLAKDAAYVALGFGVLSFQRAQVRRQEFTKVVEARVGDLGHRLAEVEANVDETIERVARQLPEPASGVVTQLHSTAKSARSQVRSRRRAA